ncbi:hypothetical protein Cadr_000024047 [Camelus dromedarius]|uniref:Uncharacterized protein n=1 Tax=Camelus dromedarius TaxID=9838 RepID=A0A5N4CWH2_CAMDR|nr:hypothetical protein Cadr_000024047 [Camelus dromedarius]
MLARQCLCGVTEGEPLVTFEATGREGGRVTAQNRTMKARKSVKRGREPSTDPSGPLLSEVQQESEVPAGLGILRLLLEEEEYTVAGLSLRASTTRSILHALVISVNLRRSGWRQSPSEKSPHTLGEDTGEATYEEDVRKGVDWRDNVRNVHGEGWSHDHVWMARGCGSPRHQGGVMMVKTWDTGLRLPGCKPQLLPL